MTDADADAVIANLPLLTVKVLALLPENECEADEWMGDTQEARFVRCGVPQICVDIEPPRRAGVGSDGEHYDGTWDDADARALVRAARWKVEEK